MERKTRMAQVNQPLVDIVVPTYRRKDLLKRLIDSLFKLSYAKERYKIIIVGDSTFDDGTEHLVKSLMTTAPVELKYIKCRLSAPSVKRNAGIKSARGEIIGFTDDDCIVDPNWINRVVPYFLDQSVVGVQGQTIVPLPDQLGPSYHRATRLMKPGYQTCNIFYRRSVLKEIGGFDEQFTISSREDSDLAFTLLEKGYTIAFAPEAIVEHPARGDEPWDLVKSAKKGSGDSLLFKKHPRLYREEIGRAFPNSYRVFYLLSVAILISLVLQRSFLVLFSLLLYLGFLFWQASRHLKDVGFSLVGWGTVLISLLVSPYVLLWSVIKGNLKHRSLLWR